MRKAEKKLRTVLKGNALFSLASGLSLLLFSKRLGAIMNVQNADVLHYIGIALLIFVALLLYNAFKSKINKTLIKSIIVQDWAWVLGSLVLLVLNPFQISTTGNILIALVALIVMSFAMLQQRSLQQLSA